MNLQEKVMESAAAIGARAARRLEGLKAPLATLKVAGRDFTQVARLHVSRFVQENRAIATDAGKDFTALARSTYASLAKTPTAPRKRKATVSRKRPKDKAA